MNRNGEYMRKKIKIYVVIAALLMIFIAVVIIVTVSAQKLYHLSDTVAGIIVSVMSTFLGAILGGTFTLLAVDRTISKQHDIQFVNEFPEKIRMLDELLIQLKGFKLKLNKENGPFLIIDRNNLSDQYDLATNVDGFTYFQIRQAHEVVSKIIEEMFFSQRDRLYTEDSYGAWHLIDGKDETLDANLEELNILVSQLINKMENYRKNFIDNYNKSIKVQ
ncbi:hypothetical protein [Peribacillus phoenicis]|uniref:hypothetical protein n=1 Tax=unclassified Peribacillus TaxID=2675266 RepID=UPI00399F451F